jgi:hypothetical protein
MLLQLNLCTMTTLGTPQKSGCCAKVEGSTVVNNDFLELNLIHKGKCNFCKRKMRFLLNRFATQVCFAHLPCSRKGYN